MMVEKNVLAQNEHLRNHPSVNKALADGELKLHSWVYDFETGEVHVHDQKSQRFISLAERQLPAGKVR